MNKSYPSIPILPVSPRITNNVRKLRLSTDSGMINSDNDDQILYNNNSINNSINNSKNNNSINSINSSINNSLSSNERVAYELEITELRNKCNNYDILLKSYISKDSNNIKLSNIVSNDLEIKLENLNKYNNELLNIISSYDIELNKWRNRALSLNNNKKYMTSPRNNNKTFKFIPPTSKENENISPDFNIPDINTISPFGEDSSNINLPSLVSPTSTSNNTTSNIAAWLPKINTRDEKKFGNNSDEDDDLLVLPTKEYLNLNPSPKSTADEFHSNLKSCFKEILFQTDKEVMFKKLTEQALQLVGAERSSVFVVNEIKREFIAKYSSSKNSDRIGLMDSGEVVVQLVGETEGGIRGVGGHGIVGSTFLSGEPINVPSVNADKRFVRAIDALSKNEVRSMLCIPIFSPHHFTSSRNNLIDTIKYQEKEIIPSNTDINSQNTAMSSASDVIPLDQNSLTHHMYRTSPSPLINFENNYESKLDSVHAPPFSVLFHLLDKLRVSKSMRGCIGDRYIPSIKANAILVVYNKTINGKIGPFNNHDQSLLTLLSYHFSQALWDSYVLEVYQKEREKSRSLLLGTDSLTRGADLRTLLCNITQSIRNLSNADFVIIMGDDPIEEELIVLGVDCDSSVLIRIPNSFSRQQKLMKKVEEKRLLKEEQQIKLRLKSVMPDQAPSNFARRASINQVTSPKVREKNSNNEIDPSFALQMNQEYPMDEPLRVSYHSGGLANLCLLKGEIIKITDTLQDRKFNPSCDEYLLDRSNNENAAIPKKDAKRPSIADNTKKKQISYISGGGTLTRVFLVMPIIDAASPEAKLGDTKLKLKPVGVAVIGRAKPKDFEVSEIMQIDDLIQLASVAIRKYKLTGVKDSTMKNNMGRIANYLNRLDISPDLDSDSLGLAPV